MGHKHMASAVYPRLRKEGCFGKMVVISVMPQYLFVPMVAYSALHAQSCEFILHGVIVDKAPTSFHLLVLLLFTQIGKRGWYTAPEAPPTMLVPFICCVKSFLACS